MGPTIEFECGMTTGAIGSIGLACKAHVGKCTNDKCQAEVTSEAKKAGLTVGGTN